MTQLKQVPDSHRRFLTSYLVTFGTLMAGIAVVNLLVDPYSQYGLGLLPPIVRTSRGEKMRLLSEQGPPQGLVLGSSRVMKLEPAYLQARTGLHFFNAGVYFGRTEDFLALVRASHERFNRWPRLLVVGLDIDAFVEQPGPDARLLRHADLRRQIPELLTWNDRLRPVRELWSWQQSVSSLRSLRHGRSLAEESASDESFASDGRVIYHRRERELAEGRYDMASACDFSRREYRRIYREYRQLSTTRTTAWRELASLCDDHGIELVVFLTTWRPEALANASLDGSFSERRQQVISLVESTLPARGSFVDLSEIASFDGDPKLFVDGVHPLEPNTRRMIDVLFPQIPSLAAGAPYVIQ